MSIPANICSDFKPVSKSEWLAKIEKDLKGRPLADLHAKLGALTLDPFPHADDLNEMPLPLKGDGNDWEIGEDIQAEDIVKANKLAIHALKNGVKSVRFHLSENLGDHRLEALLEGIDFSAVSIHFFEKNKNANPAKLLHHFHHIASLLKVDHSQLRGSVNWHYPKAVVMDDRVELLEFAIEKMPAFKVLPINGGAYYQGAEKVVEELFGLIRNGNQILIDFNERGFDPELVNGKLQFSIVTGTNYFVEIAKIRALKLLWANVIKGWNVNTQSMPPIDGYLAESEQKDDPYINMIQATTQSMSAVIGGVDRLTVLPGQTSDEQLGFAQRIARNVQHILKMESHLNWVADPSAGSYFIETLTTDLAKAAWKMFQQKDAENL